MRWVPAMMVGVGVGMLAIGSQLQAAVVTIDFEDFVMCDNDGIGSTTVYEEAGFRISSDPYSFKVISRCNTSLIAPTVTGEPSDQGFWGGEGESTALESRSNALFRLHSLQIAARGGHGAGDSIIEVLGVSEGESFTRYFDNRQLQQFTFSNEWTDLRKLQFTQVGSGYQNYIDNIVLSSPPERPAAVPAPSSLTCMAGLFAMGLFAAGWRRWRGRGQ